MTKYPIILVHGIAIREMKLIKAFGKIERKLKEAGYDAYTANTDAFGSIENNAKQLKEIILKLIEDKKTEKVNIIAHSKGGLDAKHMIARLGMEDKVASLTTLCTPHKGSAIATKIWALPSPVKKSLAFFINGFYKLIGDKSPDSIKVCEELKSREEADGIVFSDKVYCQSYSTTLKSGKDCLLMATFMRIYNKVEGVDNDGVVSVESAKFENYRGECLDESVSHTQIVDIFAKRKNRHKIFGFYIGLCDELSRMGF